MTASNAPVPDISQRRAEIAPDAMFRQSVRCLTDAPKPGSRKWLARAPGCLDVMGGITEYTGAVILALTIAEGVTTTVQLREDNRVVIHGRRTATDDYHDPVSLDLNAFIASGVVEPSRIVSDATELNAVPWVAPAVAAIHAMHASGKLNQASGGLDIVVDSSLPPLRDLSYPSAVIVSAMHAMCGAWGLRLDPFECVQLAVTAENTGLNHPCGPGPAMSLLHGLSDTIVQINCRERAVIGNLNLPVGVRIVGIDCAAKRADANEKYASARTTAMMGRDIIQQILAARGSHGVQWNGWLSQLTSDDYVTFLRDRIPTKMRGAGFLDSYGPATDPLTRVDPEAVYKIRSRTEHHIYEAGRTRLFAERLAHAGRTNDSSALLDAGEEMHGSNWSYGQRCALGSVETEQMVNLLRAKRSQGAGVFGAKTSGAGAGGVVVALIEDSDRAREAIDDVLTQYEKETSCHPTLYGGHSPGLLQYGIHEG